MKRLLINITVLFVLAAGFTSCKKKIEEDYSNPEQTATGSLGKLLAGMYLNKRVHPSYWDYYTFVMPTLSLYTQAVATPPATKMYVPSIDYNESRWVDYYAGSTGTDYNYNGPGILSNYREMQTTYAALSATEQAQQTVFLKCAQVLLYDQTAQMVDLWGDIPFFKAGTVNTAGRDISYAPFDDAASIYDTLITNLKDLNTYFDTAAISTVVSAELKKQDIVLGGDLSLWQRYANSLRLRLLMRISNKDVSTAQTGVTEMLNSPGTYPLITDNSQNVLLKESPNALKSDLNDVFTAFRFAPSYMLDTLMVPNADPRTPVFWDAYGAGSTDYHGFPYNGTNAAYEAGGYATYDTATFFYNYNLPGVIFTAAEVSFLKAEAYERWGLGTAQTEYENGIKQSVAFYYGINQSRILKTGTYPTLASPSDAVVSAYIAMPAIAYSGTTQEKLAKIYTQKWEHFFILQAGQSWAEVRRTGYPVLQYATATYAGAETPPVRLLYPSTEQLYNTSNYSNVSSKDTRDTKIFWDVN